MIKIGPMSFKLEGVMLKGGHVSPITEEGEEVVTAFVRSRDVQFVVADNDKPIVEVTIEVVDKILACQSAVIRTSETRANDLQEQLDVLGAFPRGQ